MSGDDRKMNEFIKTAEKLSDEELKRNIKNKVYGDRKKTDINKQSLLAPRTPLIMLVLQD